MSENVSGACRELTHPTSATAAAYEKKNAGCWQAKLSHSGTREGSTRVEGAELGAERLLVKGVELWSVRMLTHAV